MLRSEVMALSREKAMDIIEQLQIAMKQIEELRGQA
jgi:hypothetical protein